MKKKKTKTLKQVRSDMASSIKSWLSSRYPHMYCVFKRRLCFHFSSESDANDAFEHSMQIAEKQMSSGYLHVPKRVYKCPCGYWHFTHLESFNPPKKLRAVKKTGFFD